MNTNPPTTFEMGLDELYPTSCYNCSNDCPGILLEIFREGEKHG